MKKIIGETKDRVKKTGRNVYFAGMGLVSTVTDRSAGLFEGLVEKGKTAAEKNRKDDSRGVSLSERIKRTTHSVSEKIQRGVSQTLGRTGVPTREELRDLSQSIERLAQKVDRLHAEGRI